MPAPSSGYEFLARFLSPCFASEYILRIQQIRVSNQPGNDMSAKYCLGDSARQTQHRYVRGPFKLLVVRA